MIGYQARTERTRPFDRTTRQRMKVSLVTTSVAIAALLLIASADDGFPARRASLTPVVATFSNVPSHNGAYRASMIPSPHAIEPNIPLVWTVEIRTAAGLPVEGASLALESWMPDDESVSVTRPRTTAELGGGRYRVAGLRFGGRGWWNVRLRVSGAGVTDSLAFNLVLR